MLSDEEKTLLVNQASMDQFKEELRSRLADLSERRLKALAARMETLIAMGDDVSIRRREAPLIRDLAVCGLWDLCNCIDPDEEDSDETTES